MKKFKLLLVITVIILSIFVSAPFASAATTGVDDGRVGFTVADKAGDANGDGVVDVRDLVCMKKYLAHGDNATYTGYIVLNAANITTSNDTDTFVVNASDLTELRKLILTM